MIVSFPNHQTGIKEQYIRHEQTYAYEGGVSRVFNENKWEVKTTRNCEISHLPSFGCSWWWWRPMGRLYDQLSGKERPCRE